MWEMPLYSWRATRVPSSRARRSGWTEASSRGRHGQKSIPSRQAKLENMEPTIRVAVITGASQGIGRRTAEVLAGRGYALALNDIQSTQGTLDSVRQIGVPAIEVL